MNKNLDETIKLTIIGSPLANLLDPFLEKNKDINLVKKLDFKDGNYLYVLEFSELISKKVLDLFQDRQKIEDSLGYTPVLFYTVDKGNFPKDLDPFRRNPMRNAS